MRLFPGKSAESGIRYTLVAVFVVGVRQRNPGAVVNAVFAVLGTYVTDVFELFFDVDFRPWQRLYVDFAMLIHAEGMLGPYDDVWWWDHLTHTLSASIIGGFVFAAARRRDRNPRPLVLGSVVVLGIFWELIEYVIHAIARRFGLEPILVIYSKRDTVLDLVYNLVGAFLVMLFGDRLLGNLFEFEK